eukprot:jgi/Botrbrau1/11770/Bobra.0195s0095.1
MPEVTPFFDLREAMPLAPPLEVITRTPWLVTSCRHLHEVRIPVRKVALPRLSRLHRTTPCTHFRFQHFIFFFAPHYYLTVGFPSSVQTQLQHKPCSLKTALLFSN